MYSLLAGYGLLSLFLLFLVWQYNKLERDLLKLREELNWERKWSETIIKELRYEKTITTELQRTIDDLLKPCITLPSNPWRSK